ncbi:hypothetical protein [Ruminococcus sp.]|uniref:hypothetical protein n=1 Tax=Ruminococcus sp. TaxID=41978 RepID=UPI001B5026E6|nr:hypothetical protein [Ruminococcus sp.]MBP5432335.1 hypothetical protein [Ruminococcus sp.]
MPRICRYDELVKPYLKNITEWVSDLTEGQIARRLGVSTTTFKAYKDKYPELQDALTKGNQNLIEELKSIMKQTAKGYYKENTKTRYHYIGDPADGKIESADVEVNKQWYPPNVAAANMLLKNLDDTWSDNDAATRENKKKQLEIQQQKADNAI